MTECVSCAKFKGCDLSSPNVNDCADYKEQMTNEEWFCGLSTEEKAEFLIASIKKCKSCASGIGVDEVQHCPFGECGCHFKDEVVEWLKQPHSEVGK